MRARNTSSSSSSSAAHRPASRSLPLRAHARQTRTSQQLCAESGDDPRADRPNAADGRPRVASAQWRSPSATQRRLGRRPPPQNLEAEQSVLGAVLLSDTDAVRADHRRGPQARGLLPRARTALIFGAMLDLYDRASRSTRSRSPSTCKQAGQLEDGRRPRGGRRAGRPRPRRRQRPPVRADRHARTRCSAACCNATYEIQAQVHSPRGAAARAGRARRALDPRGRARRPPQGLPRDRRRPRTTRSTSSQQLSARRHVDHRHAVRLRGPRRDHRRLPARQPDHPRRPPVDGQVARWWPTSPRTRRCTDQQAGRAVQPRDVRGRARAALHRRARRRSRATTCARARCPERWPKVLAGRQHARQAPLYIDDSTDIAVLDIRAKARRLAQQQVDGGLGLIVVDYLQLMRADSRSREPRRAGRPDLRGLKMLARELEVPVIALSQLSRARRARARQARRCSPTCASPAPIEQDADLVMFIYRDEYYDEDTEHPGEAELHHRQAPQRRPRQRRRSTSRTSTRASCPTSGEERYAWPSCPDGLCDGSGFLVDEETRRRARLPLPAAAHRRRRRAARRR